jgi:hypothetical protein
MFLRRLLNLDVETCLQLQLLQDPAVPDGERGSRAVQVSVGVQMFRLIAYSSYSWSYGL